MGVWKTSRIKKWRNALVAQFKKIFSADKAKEASSVVITESL
jgi:hypothetical protein